MKPGSQKKALDPKTLAFDLTKFVRDTDENGISLQDIEEEIQSAIEHFEPTPHNQVLSRLLFKVSRVDFRNLAELENENANLKKKHYLVSAVDEIIKLAKIHNWGLCKKHDFVYLYNGAFWGLLNEDEIKNFLGSAGEKMGIDKFDCRLYAFKDQLYKQFLSAAYLPEPDEHKEVVLINLLNGTFEVSPTGGELRNFNQDDFICYQLPFAYDPEANAPIFESYLNRVQPDKEMQDILAEYLAYIFTKHLKLEKTLLLYGTGANGKSVFFDIVNALLGKENVTTYSLQSLTNESGYYRAKLGNALVNYASEINGKLETSIFKQLVSGEPVEARLPYGEPFTLKKYARMIFNCNELPREVEYTHAYFRRFLIIPFDVTIPEEEQDNELANKIIKDELSGVFNWVLKGLERLIIKKRFTESEMVKRQIEQYKLDSNSVHLFLDEEGYCPSLKECKPLKDIFILYKLFCLDNGFKPTSTRTLAQRLRNSGFSIERKNYGNAVYIEKK